jgi:hypothetical protein
MPVLNISKPEARRNQRHSANINKTYRFVKYFNLSENDKTCFLSILIYLAPSPVRRKQAPCCKIHCIQARLPSTRLVIHFNSSVFPLQISSRVKAVFVRFTVIKWLIFILAYVVFCAKQHRERYTYKAIYFLIESESTVRKLINCSLRNFLPYSNDDWTDEYFDMHTLILPVSATY